MLPLRPGPTPACHLITAQGHISVMNRNREMLALLTTGGFFGELALLATSRRTAQCVAVSHCDLSLLSAHDLVHAMSNFPESAAKVSWRPPWRSHQHQARLLVQNPCVLY